MWFLNYIIKLIIEKWNADEALMRRMKRIMMSALGGEVFIFIFSCPEHHLHLTNLGFISVLFFRNQRAEII